MRTADGRQQRRRSGGDGAACACAVLLAGCTSSPAPDDGPPPPRTATPPRSSGRATAPRPVPLGKGSRVPADFNGDGHRDLVLNDLVKAPDDSHGDDAGIGVVYGTAGPRALDPAVRRLLTPRANAAPVDGTLPAAFDAEAACDLDKDGFSDLIVATDPPYNGIGRPPVPLQLLFGSPAGLGGKAVVLRIPEKARYGNDWPDHPVCGDFDGDGCDRPRRHRVRGPGQLPARPLHPHRRPARRHGPRPGRRPGPVRPVTRSPTRTATATTTWWSPPAPRSRARRPRASCCWAARTARAARAAVRLRRRTAPPAPALPSGETTPTDGRPRVRGLRRRQAPRPGDSYAPGRARGCAGAVPGHRADAAALLTFSTLGLPALTSPPGSPGQVP